MEACCYAAVVWLPCSCLGFSQEQIDGFALQPVTLKFNVALVKIQLSGFIVMFILNTET